MMKHALVSAVVAAAVSSVLTLVVSHGLPVQAQDQELPAIRARSIEIVDTDGTTRLWLRPSIIAVLSDNGQITAALGPSSVTVADGTGVPRIALNVAQARPTIALTDRQGASRAELALDYRGATDGETPSLAFYDPRGTKRADFSLSLYPLAGDWYPMLSFYAAGGSAYSCMPRQSSGPVSFMPVPCGSVFR